MTIGAIVFLDHLAHRQDRSNRISRQESSPQRFIINRLSQAQDYNRGRFVCLLRLCLLPLLCVQLTQRPKDRPFFARQVNFLSQYQGSLQMGDRLIRVAIPFG